MTSQPYAYRVSQALKILWDAAQAERRPCLEATYGPQAKGLRRLIMVALTGNNDLSLSAKAVQYGNCRKALLEAAGVCNGKCIAEQDKSFEEAMQLRFDDRSQALEQPLIDDSGWTQLERRLYGEYQQAMADAKLATMHPANWLAAFRATQAKFASMKEPARA
jgi:hypothetical protein